MYGSPQKDNFAVLACLILKSSELTTMKTVLLVPKRIVDIAPSPPFKKMVANMTNSPVLVHKHTNLSKLTERRITMVHMIDNQSTDTHDHSIIVIPFYKGNADKSEQMRLHQKVETSEG